MAGGPHGPRHARGGRGGGRKDDPRIPAFRRGVDVAARGRGPQVAQRALRRRRGHAHHRGPHAGRQGVAERHVALPGPELRQGVRRAVREQGGQARIRVGHLVGRIDPPDGRPHHGPLRQQRPRAAAQAGADPRGDGAHLQGPRADGRHPRTLRRPRRRAARPRPEREGGRPRQRALGLQVRRVRAQGRARTPGHGSARHGERHDRTRAPRHARKADRTRRGPGRPHRGADGRDSGEHLPQGPGLPRVDDYARGYVGRVQAPARREGRLPLGALGRHGRNRGGDQGGDQGHDPLHSDRRSRGGGRLHLLR